jgi:hypothetical protein
MCLLERAVKLPEEVYNARDIDGNELCDTMDERKG